MALNRGMARRGTRAKAKKKAQRRVPERRGRGRPPVHEESWRKTTVVLFDRQIAELDQLARTMRDKHGSGPTRAEIIRAVVDGVLSSPLNLVKASAETEIRSMVARRLAKPAATRKKQAAKPAAPEPVAERAEEAPVSLAEEAARLRGRAEAIRKENPSPKLEDYRKRGRPMEYQPALERWMEVMRTVDAFEDAAYRLGQAAAQPTN